MANESVAAAEEKAAATALAQERERVVKSEAEALKLAAKLKDADAVVDELRDAVSRQKQETYYLYTQYANSPISSRRPRRRWSESRRRWSVCISPSRR